MELRVDARQPGLGWQLTGLLAWLAATFAAAALAAFGSFDSAGFYDQLRRPQWAPPAALFGPVWSLLYLMMATAAWLVWREPSHGHYRPGLVLFSVQLAFNALWPWLFFAWREGGWASAQILLLWVLVALNVSAFWRIRRVAGLLLLPYLAWVGFASALTHTLWRMNPGLLR